MKYWVLFTSLICSPLVANLSEESLVVGEARSRITVDPLTSLDHLISSTEETLQKEKRLRTLMVEYEKVQAICFRDPDDRDRMVVMVKKAQDLLAAIKELNVLYMFDEDFLKELSLFSRVATKNTVEL